MGGSVWYIFWIFGLLTVLFFAIFYREVPEMD